VDDTLFRATTRVEILQGTSRVGWGTGFLVGARHLLTAFHVVKDCVPGPNTLRIRHPTAREATLALAGMGAHLKHNGEPGWLTIGRGY